MLILTRKNGESIKIGDNIEITIVSAKNDQVKIGIKAPKEIEVVRNELFEETLSENQEASIGIEELKQIINKINKK
ncbi:carbon storage regulator CsrA [Bacillus sp. CECT 9360]|uniref:carbon storage regulator CsrA n=1 Tax=Bacillus sp. CECT 9360 TaxID=2845821 RepID=UPI001E3C2B15|nr:carbon storage regulator CsrA [Bacillus sp. CECT 9360]CAH0344850.1 Translational regulator CsrA [Bacillus sp. CECT 9360]